METYAETRWLKAQNKPFPPELNGLVGRFNTLALRCDKSEEWHLSHDDFLGGWVIEEFEDDYDRPKRYPFGKERYPTHKFIDALSTEFETMAKEEEYLL